MSVLVFANGEIENVGWIRPYLSEATAVVAADGGSRHLRRLDYPPDLVIGDMDSLPEDVESWLTENGVRFLSHPAAKDETDLELALLHAVAHYQDEILILGALGGRLDQTLANILLLAHPALNGRSVQLVHSNERAWLVTESTRIYGKPGDVISLIPLGGDVQIEATSGLRWKLQEETLTFGPARGVSNEMVADEATVALAAGKLLCIHEAGEG